MSRVKTFDLTIIFKSRSTVIYERKPILFQLRYLYKLIKAYNDYKILMLKWKKMKFIKTYRR